MATETDIPEILVSKKGEREDNVLSSDILEEKVTELPGNKVKQLETSSQVAESVNTQLETSTSTNESGTFFQALSVPLDEGTPESSKAATTEEQEERKTKSEALEKPFGDESVQIVASKEEENDKPVDSQEASEQWENGAKDKEEQEPKESVNINVHEKTGLEKVEYEEVKQSDSSNIDINEKTTSILSKDEDPERKEEGNVLEKEQGEDAVTSSQDTVLEEGVQEKIHYSEGNEPEVVKSKESIGEDIEETTIQHATTVAKIEEEQILSAPPKNVPKEEEVEDGTIDPEQASEKCENGAKAEREPKPEESVNIIAESSSEIEQEKITEEIKPSVETEEKIEQGLLNDVTTDVSITSLSESQIDNTEHEVKGEETGSQKVEYKEEVIHSDSSNVEINEKTVAILSKDEDQEEGNTLEKELGEDTIVTSSWDATFEGVIQEKVHNSEGNEPEVVKTEESIAEGIEEIRTSEESVLEKVKSEEGLKDSDSPSIVLSESEIASKVENEEKEQEDKSTGAEETVVSDDGQTEKSESPLVKEVCEATGIEKVELEEGLKDFDGSSATLNENEIVSKEENQEKEQKLEIPEEVEGDGDDVVSTQNASNEDIKETTSDQNITEIIKEEVEDKSVDALEYKREEEPEESVNTVVESCSEIEQEKDTEEIKPSVDAEETTEQQELLHTITTDACIREKTESQVESEELEVKDDKAIESDDGQKENIDSPLVKDVYEETGAEKVEYKEEGKETKDENEIVSKVEVEEKEQEVYVSEEVKDGQNDVTSSEAATCEDIKDTSVGQHVTAVAEEVSEENENGAKDITEQNTSSSNVETKENEEKIDEEAIVNDDGQTNKSESHLVTEVCEVTGSEKTEIEKGIKDFDSVSTTMNEAEIVGKEENEEKEQETEEVKGGGDDVITSQSTLTKENFKEEAEDKSIDAQQNKGEKEPEESVNKIVESYSEIEQEKDTEEIKASIGTEEKIEEQELLHAATTDTFITSQKEHEVESVKPVVKNDKAIESDDGQKENVDSPLVKEVYEETGSEKVEYMEEVKETTNENEIVSKVEVEEKEQEVYISEEVKDGQNDVTSSEDATTSEDIKETTIGHVTTVAEDIIEQNTSLYSVETKENEEKIDDETLVNDDGQTNKSESPLVNEVSKVTSSEKAELEERKKDIDSVSTTLNEIEIVRKEENVEKEQEQETKEFEVGGDNVITSQSTISKEIFKEETEDKVFDAQEDKREEKAEESVNKIVESYPETEQEKDTEEIKPSVETEEKELEEQELLHATTTSQTESQVESSEQEVKSDKAIESDDGQKENVDSPLVKEACEETGLEKVEYKEEVKETSNENEIVNKVEVEEKEQEVYVSEEVKDGQTDVTSSEDATCEDIKETITGNKVVTSKEILKEEAEEKSSDAQEASEEYEQGAKDITDQNISSYSVETIENVEKIDDEAIVNDDDQTNKSESPLVTEVEVTSVEKAETVEGLKEFDSSVSTLNESEIVSKEENEEKEQEKEVGSGGDDVITSQNAITKEIFKEEEAADKAIYAQEDKGEQKPQESVDKSVEPCLEIKQEEDTEEVKPSVEIEEKTEQHGLLHAATTDDSITVQTESQIESAQFEVKSDETVQSADDHNENVDSSLVKEVTGSEEVEYKEEVKETMNENEIVNKVEVEEKEQEVFVSEEVQAGQNEVVSLQDAICDDIKETAVLSSTPKEILKEEALDKSSDAQEASEKNEIAENEIIEQKPEESVNKVEITEEIETSVETDEKEQVKITEHEEEVIESDDVQKENSDNLSIKEVSEETRSERVELEGVEISSKDEDQEKEQEPIKSEEDQGKEEPEYVKTREYIEEDKEEIKSSIETKENVEKIDEEAIVNDDGQTEKSESPLVKEVCEVTGSEKAESEEGLKDFDSSVTPLNENEIVSKEENDEKEQEKEEIKGGGDDVITSQNAITKAIVKEEAEDLSSDVQEDKKEQTAAESVNKIVESCSEIEKDEDTEEMKPIVETELTEDLTISQTESLVESTEQEVKSDKAIESDDGQKEIVDTPSVKEVCEENEISRKVEDEEKEQEVYVSEKEATVGQHVTTVDYVEEGQTLSSIPTEILNEEALDNISDAQEVSETYEIVANDIEEQKPEESVKIIENTREIETSVETDEKEQAKITGNEEEVIESKDVHSEKVELEGTELSSKDEDQEKEQEHTISKQDKGKDDVTCSQDETSKEPEFVKTREYIEEDTEESKSSIETKENVEKFDEEAIVNDDGQTQKSENPLEKEVCEVTGSEKDISEEVLNDLESSSRTLNEDDTVSNEENQEKEQEPEEVQGENASSEDVKETTIDQSVMTKEILTEEVDDKSSDVHEDNKEEKPEESVNKIVESCSEIEQEDNTKEIKPSVESEKHEVKSDEAIQSDDGQKEHTDTPSVKEVYEKSTSEKVEFNEEVKDKPDENEIVTEVEDKEKDKEVDVTTSQDATCEDVKETTVGQYVTTLEEGQALSSIPKEILKEEAEENSSDAQEDKNEQKAEESVIHIVESCEIEQEEDTTEIKPSVETMHSLTTDEITIPQTESQVESVEQEVKSDMSIQSDDGQKESVDTPLVKEVCEENEISSKVEDEEKEQEVDVSDKEAIVGQHFTTVDYVEEGQTLSSIPKEILKEEVEEKSSYAQEVVSISAQKFEEETTKTEEKKEESIKEVYEETAKKVGDETSSKKVEFEEETFKNEDQEKDNVTTSQVSGFEEELQEKNYQDEGKEPEFVKSREFIVEDTEEIKSSVETTENTEQHVITTDVCDSTETEAKEETKKNEVKVEEEAVVNDDGQTEQSKSPLVKEVCEVAGSEKAELDLGENETVSKEENQEKEQKLEIPEEVKVGGDDVVSSQEEICEDIKETVIGQQVTTVVGIEESKDQSALTEEILKEEAEVKSSDAQEASEKFDEKVEEKPEESVNIIEQEKYTEEKPLVPSVKEVCEETRLEKAESEEVVKPSDSSNYETIIETFKDEDQEKDQEVNISEEDLQKEPEVVKSRDIVEEDTEEIKSSVDTTEKTEQKTDVCDLTETEAKEDTKEIEEKIKEEAIVNDDGQAEKFESLLVRNEVEVNKDEILTKEDNQENQADITEDKSVKDDIIISTEKISSELGQLKEQNVEEIQEGLTKTISEDTEDEITKKDEILSHDDIKGTKDDTTKEEECFLEGKTREIEPVEEQSSGLDEVSKEKDTDLKEVEPQEDIIPSSSLESVTKEIPSEEKTEQTTETGENNSLYEKGDIKEDVTQVDQPNSTEDCSEISKDFILTKEISYPDPSESVESPTTETKSRNLEDEIIKKDENFPHDEKVDTKDDTTIKEKCSIDERTKETEPVEKQSGGVDEVSEETSRDLIGITEVKPQEDVKKNLELHEELKPITELVTEEDQLKETKFQPEQSDIISENITKEYTNQKELADEIEYSKPIQPVTTEVTEVKAESPIELEEKPTEVSEVTEIVPKGIEVSASLPQNLPEASPTTLLEKNVPETTTAVEIIEDELKDKEEAPVIDVQKHERSLDVTNEAIISDVSTKETALESINKEKESDKSIGSEIPTEKEPLKLDAIVTPGTTVTKDLEISQKSVTDDFIKGEEKKTGEKLIEEREIDLIKDEKVDKEEIGEKGAKTDEENEEEDDEDNHINDAPVMVEASKDIEVKPHKKSHNILSGVGSKVKHSIAKVKKAITGKSSHPKEKDQVVT